MISQEQATAVNIKNKINRKSVQTALKNIMSQLKNRKTISDNGIAIYASQYI